VLLVALVGARAYAAAKSGTTPKATKPASSSTTPKTTPARKYPVTGEYVPMIRECGLTPEQVEQLGAKIQAKKDALAAFDRQKPLKKMALQKDLTAARAKGDKQAIQKNEEALKALDQERVKIEATQEAQILGVLKPEQRLTWEGYLLYQVVAGELKASGLTEAQSARLRTMCNESAKKIVSAPDRAKVRKDVAAEIVKAVQAHGIDAEAPAAEPEKSGDKPKVGRSDTGKNTGR
jgi:hypothetical protein